MNNRSPRNILLFLSILLCAGSFCTPALAQSLGSPIGQSQPAPVQYILSPQNPGPDAPVDIEIQGVGGFLGNSQITWQRDGKTVLSGIGAREYLFTTGPLGAVTTISIDIDTAQYGMITKQFTFNPSRVDLVWQANTSVPPFYEGLALASPGSHVTVAAFPEVISHSAAKGTSSLSFQWSLDGQAMPDQSGMGLNTFSFTADQLHQNATVDVDVYDGAIAAGHAEITIPFVQPQLALYVHDPLRGMLYNQALGSTVAMQGTEMTVHAEPYFFSVENRNDYSYGWQLNGNNVAGPNTAQGELTVRQTGSGQGNAQLSVSLQNNAAGQLLQATQTMLNISFGGTGSSFFGL